MSETEMILAAVRDGSLRAEVEGFAGERRVTAWMIGAADVSAGVDKLMAEGKIAWSGVVDKLKVVEKPRETGKSPNLALPYGNAALVGSPALRDAGKPDAPENAGKNSCRELGSNLYDFGSPALADVVEERHRQKTKEGFTEAHDDEHNKNGELARVAVLFAMDRELIVYNRVDDRLAPIDWPLSWSRKWWKPTTRRRDLVKAAALLLAEIERIDRASGRIIKLGPGVLTTPSGAEFKALGGTVTLRNTKMEES